MINNMIPLLFLLLSGLAFIGISIDTLIYLGFVKNYFFIDPRTLVLLSLLISSINLILKKPYSIPQSIIKANNYILLPLTLGSTVIFTILELINYPNFVFSTIHLHYESLFYLFIISISISLFSVNKTALKINRERVIFGLSLLLISSLVIIRTWPGGTFYNLIREDSLFENLQFIFYAFAAISSTTITIMAFSNKSKLTFLYFLFFSFFLIFIAGEEISWGQRIFHISSPEIAVEHNTQQETTIHNFDGLNDLQPAMYMLFSLYLSTAWIIIKIFPKRVQPKFAYLVPNWYYVFYFIPIFAFYLHINILSGSHWEWQEACELLLAIGLFVFTSEKILRKDK